MCKPGLGLAIARTELKDQSLVKERVRNLLLVRLSRVVLKVIGHRGQTVLVLVNRMMMFQQGLAVEIAPSLDKYD